MIPILISAAVTPGADRVRGAPPVALLPLGPAPPVAAPGCASVPPAPGSPAPPAVTWGRPVDPPTSDRPPAGASPLEAPAARPFANVLVLVPVPLASEAPVPVLAMVLPQAA